MSLPAVTIRSLFTSTMQRLPQTPFSASWPRADELRWLRPVYPGDVLSAENEVLEARALRSRPEIATVKLRTTTYNQDNQPVLTMTANIIVPVSR